MKLDMKHLGKSWGLPLLIAAGYFGFQYVVPLHLNCESGKNEQNLRNLLDKWYARTLPETRKFAAKLDMAVPGTLAGEFSNVRTVKKAGTANGTAECAATFTFAPGYLLRKADIEFQLVGEDVFSKRYQIKIAKIEPEFIPKVQGWVDVSRQLNGK